VGAVAELLNTSPSTLRTWERRYGLGPSLRTSGGHRRYSALDIDRVDLMCRLLARGVSAQNAAEVAQRLTAGQAIELDELTRAAGTSRQLADEIAREAQRLDGRGLQGSTAAAIRIFGVIDAWDQVFGPALEEIARRAARGVVGVETGFVASACMLSVLRAYGGEETSEPSGPTVVVLASPEDDRSRLPIVALEAALSERGVAAFEVGVRWPNAALESIVAGLRPRVVLVWASQQRPEQDPVRDALERIDDETTVILAGPGWQDNADSLMSAREALELVLTLTGA